MQPQSVSHRHREHVADDLLTATVSRDLARRELSAVLRSPASGVSYAIQLSPGTAYAFGHALMSQAHALLQEIEQATPGGLRFDTSEVQP